MFRTLCFYLCIPAAVLCSCASPVKFQKLAPIDKTNAGLLIYRPSVAAYLLRSFEVRVLRFQNSFKDKEPPSEVLVLSLDANEYLFQRLPAGYYRVEIPGRPEAATIIQLESGAEHFVEIVVYSTSYFSVPRIFLKQTTRAEAVPQLLANEKMDRHKLSQD